MCNVDVLDVFLIILKCLNGVSTIKKKSLGFAFNSGQIEVRQRLHATTNNFEIVFIYSFYFKAACLKYQVHRAKTVIKD